MLIDETYRLVGWLHPTKVSHPSAGRKRPGRVTTQLLYDTAKLVQRVN